METNTPNTPDAGSAPQQAQYADIPTDTHTEPKAEIGPGDTVSFDMLESLEAAAERKTQLDAQTEAHKQKLVDEASGKTSEKKEDVIPQQNESEGEEPKKEADGEKDEKGEDKEAEQKADDEKGEKKADAKSDDNVKRVTAKVGDEDLELRFDTKVPVKIDGVEKFATLDQLVQNFSGLGHLHTKFNELKQEKSVFEQEVNDINSTIQELNELAKTDPEACITQMVEVIGGDAYKVVEEFKQSVISTANKLADMSPEERELFLANSEKDRYKKMHESEVARQAAVQERQTLDAQVTELQKAHEIEDSVFLDKAEELLSRKKNGEITEAITADVIVKEIVIDRMYDTADSIIKDLVPDRQKDAQFTDGLVQIMAQNNFGKPGGITPDEMRDIVRESFGIKTDAQQLSEKVQNQKRVATGNSRPSNPQNDDGLWSFDQLT